MLSSFTNERLIQLSSSTQPSWNCADFVENIHVIMVLGGGVPESVNDPPLYVKERCKVAADIFHSFSSTPPNILALSAGTAHLPQLLSHDGLPIWESTASAAYLMNTLGIDKDHVFVETSSYDTISNAFFARTLFTDIMGWKNVIVITSEFHMDRTRAIFDWIFGVQDERSNYDSSYKLYYVATPDLGLSDEALDSRRKHEAKGAANVTENLRPKYTTIQKVWKFLNYNHDFYCAEKLVKKTESSVLEDCQVTAALKDSYGGISNKTK
jgi:hypothetical protein